MRENFDDCLSEVLRHEGLWADHPKDPGGATMKGITLATYRRWKPKATKNDLRRITDAEVAAIYLKDYWAPLRCDELPGGLDAVAFDASVNSGPGRSAKWLQAALGVAQDGRIGPQTIAAARKANVPAAIDRALNTRLTFLRGLKTWGTFGRGWQRRVDELRAFAHLLAADGGAPVRPDAPKPKPVVTITPTTQPPKQTQVSSGGASVTILLLAALAVIAALVIFT